MITIICNIIVMTITVESSAVGGGVEYHQSVIHSESLTRSKTVSFAETHWCKAISMSVVEMYLIYTTTNTRILLDIFIALRHPTVGDTRGGKVTRHWAIVSEFPHCRAQWRPTGSCNNIMVHWRFSSCDSPSGNTLPIRAAPRTEVIFFPVTPGHPQSCNNHCQRVPSLWWLFQVKIHI